MKSTQILKSVRGKSLKTQNDLAKDLKVSRQVYCGYENNPLQCPVDILFKILCILSVNDKEIDEFFNALKQDYLSYKNELIQELDDYAEELSKEDG